MRDKDLIKRYSFTKQELEQLQDIQLGITVANAQLAGMQIYKDVLLGSVYKRCGIAGDPPKGYSKSIQYNLHDNVITYTEKKEKNVK